MTEGLLTGAWCSQKQRDCQGSTWYGWQLPQSCTHRVNLSRLNTLVPPYQEAMCNWGRITHKRPGGSRSPESRMRANDPSPIIFYEGMSTNSRPNCRVFCRKSQMLWQGLKAAKLGGWHSLYNTYVLQHICSTTHVLQQPSPKPNTTATSQILTRRMESFQTSKNGILK